MYQGQDGIQSLHSVVVCQAEEEGDQGDSMGIYILCNIRNIGLGVYFIRTSENSIYYRIGGYNGKGVKRRVLLGKRVLLGIVGKEGTVGYYGRGMYYWVWGRRVQ